jgi:uncharacterized protein (DUF849 family)
LIKKGWLKGPHYINAIFGNMYNAQIDVASVASVALNKPFNSVMCFGGIGKDQLNANILGLMYADGVRIGLEDNLYYRDKEKTTNIDLLRRIKRIMSEMDHQMMSPSEFKQMGYGNKHINNPGI